MEARDSLTNLSTHSKRPTAQRTTNSFLNRCTRPSSADNSRASSPQKSPLLQFSLSCFFFPFAGHHSYNFISCSLQGRVRTLAPSSRSTPSSPRAPRPSRQGEASRRATSTARTPRRRPSSSPCWLSSDLGIPSTTRVRVFFFLPPC